MQIDSINIKILALLQNNARTPNTEIAKTIGLTTSAVQDRIKKMESRGIIRGYCACVDPSVLGLNLTAFVGIRITPHNLAGKIASSLTLTPCVEEIYRLAGEECFLAKIRCADTEVLESVLENINNVEGVMGTRTTIVLRSISKSSGVILSAHPESKEESEGRNEPS